MKAMPWWRWLAATFIIVSIWFYGASLITMATRPVLSAQVPWQSLLADLLTFVPFTVATPLVWRYVTGTPVARLVDERGHVDRGRIALGFVAWFALTAVSTGIDALVHPAQYRYSFNAAVFVPFVLVTLLLLPAQTSAEEFFFRGWILRWAASLPPAARVTLSGLVFALPHLANPEAQGHEWTAFLAWFLLGGGWALASVRDRGIELALGAHLANNLFSLVFVGYDGAVLPTSAIFTARSVDIDATLVSLVVVVPLFLLATRRGAQ